MAGTSKDNRNTPRPKAGTARNWVEKIKRDNRRFRGGGRFARIGKTAPFPPTRQT